MCCGGGAALYRPGRPCSRRARGGLDSIAQVLRRRPTPSALRENLELGSERPLSSAAGHAEAAASTSRRRRYRLHGCRLRPARRRPRWRRRRSLEAGDAEGEIACGGARFHGHRRTLATLATKAMCRKQVNRAIRLTPDRPELPPPHARQLLMGERGARSPRRGVPHRAAESTPCTAAVARAPRHGSGRLHRAPPSPRAEPPGPTARRARRRHPRARTPPPPKAAAIASAAAAAESAAAAAAEPPHGPPPDAAAAAAAASVGAIAGGGAGLTAPPPPGRSRSREAACTLESWAAAAPAGAPSTSPPHTRIFFASTRPAARRVSMTTPANFRRAAEKESSSSAPAWRGASTLAHSPLGA